MLVDDGGKSFSLYFLMLVESQIYSNSKIKTRSRRIEGYHPYKVEVAINEWNAPLTIPRIIGGKEAKQGKYPFMASLTYQKNHVCGGTLIADDIVLSAAHCADFFEGVSVGRHDLSNDDELYEKFNIERFVKVRIQVKKVLKLNH